MDILPNELIQLILLFVNDKIVCRFVCHLWKDLLPIPHGRRLDFYSSDLARHGHYELLTWARQNGCPMDKLVAIYLARDDKLEMLEWIQSSIIGCNNVQMMAIRYGHVRIVEWTNQWTVWYSSSKKSSACYQAAYWGQFEMLKYLVSQNYVCTNEVFVGAALSGHLEMLKWLKERNLNLLSISTEQAAFSAIVRGYLDVVEWLWQVFADELRRCAFSSNNFTDAAAKYGHVEILQWLYDHAFPIGPNAWCNAIENNHFHVVRWLQKNDYVRTARMRKPAILSGNLQMLKLVDKLQPNTATHPLDITIAAMVGNLDIIKWLISRGSNWTPHAFHLAIEGGHLHILKWSKKMSVKNTTGVYGIAVTRGYFHILKWMDNEYLTSGGIDSLMLTIELSQPNDTDENKCINAWILTGTGDFNYFRKYKYHKIMRWLKAKKNAFYYNFCSSFES